jgi:hypothetical protein
LFGFDQEFISRFWCVKNICLKKEKAFKQNFFTVLLSEASEVILVGFIFLSLAKKIREQLITLIFATIYLQGFQNYNVAQSDFPRVLTMGMLFNRMFIVLVDIPESNSSKNGLLFRFHRRIEG